MHEGMSYTSEDIEHLMEWIRQRAARVENLLKMLDVERPEYSSALEDAECCDMMLEVLEFVKSSEFITSEV